MGASGAAFTAAIDLDTWDPLAAAPLDDATLGRAARAAGVRTDRVTPPFDEEMRELVLDRVQGSLEAKLAPLIQGAVGPAEFGLIVGLAERAARPQAEREEQVEKGPTFLLRTYFDRGEEPTRAGWEVFAGPGQGEPVFLDRAEKPPRETLAREAVVLACESADASDATLRAWLAALRDEARWTDAKHGGVAAYADHAMRTILADKRRSAARYLRSVRGSLPPRAGGDVLRAAEAYGHVADAADRAGAGAFDPAIALRFIEGGQRRAWANLLEGAIAHETEAHEALRSARAALRA
ncbi:MAG: hypothetical protein HYX56_06260 [Chloroflexi bacterium]|nr:hypothetical protein [Chloroflexota bacterium]